MEKYTKYADACKILNLPDDPTEEEIKKAYRKLAMIHHPDKGGSVEKIAQINAAKDILDKGNPFKRGQTRTSTQSSSDINDALNELVKENIRRTTASFNETKRRHERREYLAKKCLLKFALTAISGLLLMMHDYTIPISRPIIICFIFWFIFLFDLIRFIFNFETLVNEK